MQLHLTFSARHVRLPLSHRYALQGMLYHALASNPHYSNYVHNSGYSCGARNYKLFTFGRLSGPFMHSEHEIIFKDTVHFEVRSVDPNFVYQLGSVLCPSSQINLFENTLEILDSRIEDYSPNTCCAKISMLSPITVFETERSGYRRFIAPMNLCSILLWSTMRSENGRAISTRPHRRIFPLNLPFLRRS